MAAASRRVGGDDDGSDTTQRRFGFNERINDAFTKRERGEQKDGKEGRGRVSASM